MADNSSTAERLRIVGNDIYRAANQPGLSPVVKRSRLMRALENYNKSLAHSCDDSERSKASKNIALASRLVAKTYGEEDLQSIVFFKLQAVNHFSIAAYHGRCRDPQWCAAVNNALLDCILDTEDVFVDENFCHKDQWFTKCANAIHDKVTAVKAECWFLLADAFFKAGIVKLDEGNCKGCKSNMFDVAQPLEKARSLMTVEPNEELCEKIEILGEDAFVHQCISTSIILTKIGDTHIEKALYDEEELDMDRVFLAMDMYRQAMVDSREKDVEHEAAALSKLGLVYHNILKIEDKAREYLKLSIQMGVSLAPRNVESVEWFVKAKKAMAQIQIAAANAVEREFEEARVEMRKEYAKELVDLETAGKRGHEEFLVFVYQTHPPRNPSHTIAVHKPSTKLVLKKAYIKALRHYHGDKQLVFDDQKWRAFCEEITKLLNRHYAKLKGS